MPLLLLLLPMMKHNLWGLIISGVRRIVFTVTVLNPEDCSFECKCGPCRVYKCPSQRCKMLLNLCSPSSSYILYDVRLVSRSVIKKCLYKVFQGILSITTSILYTNNILFWQEK